ncbi:phospholipase ABHD3-like [Amphiura filiformis]|uniref:phospholipase ABHD3-like n=1 Tax=Amphiura filiformis TaxID=82378 RepID=UPI003B21B04D
MADAMDIEESYDIEETWLLLAFLIVYFTYYITKVVKKPMVVCGNTKFKEFVSRHIPIVDEHYWPTIWCFQGQLHTLLKAILNLRSSVKLNYRRELVMTPDDGEICLDWVDDPYDNTTSTDRLNSEDERPIVILIPGISGSSAEGYAKEMVQSVLTLGYKAVVFNNRGLGGATLRTPRTFAVTNTDDMRTVILHIKRKHPRAPVMAAGASAGGINLFHYLCNYGDECFLNGAMIVSVLYEMVQSTKSLESFPNIVLFNNTLTSDMVNRIVKQNLPMIQQSKVNLDVNHILKSQTIRQFHTRLTVPMFGYRDCESYYEEANLAGKMHKIQVPTLFMSAADDPFAPLSSIPVEEMKQQDNILLVATRYGGHAGFLEGLIPRGGGYIHKVFTQYIDAIFKHGDELRGSLVKSKSCPNFH